MTDALESVASLFDISRGNKLDLNKMDRCGGDFPDAVAFINRSGERNGIAGFVRPVPAVTPYESGLITVALGGSALSSFVQPRRFYTGQNVDVLTPKKDMSLDEKLYYCLCIEANRFRYSTYGREANRTLRELLLPSAAPAWAVGVSARAMEGLHGDINALLA
jgi:hypothetical protein